MIRREENHWAEYYDLRMKEIDATYKHDLKMAALCFPLVCAVAWAILAMF